MDHSVKLWQAAACSNGSTLLPLSSPNTDAQHHADTSTSSPSAISSLLHSSSKHSAKLLPFNHPNHRQWFNVANVLFGRAAIFADQAKLAEFIATLSDPALDMVDHLLYNPPSSSHFATLHTLLLERYDMPDSTLTQALFPPRNYHMFYPQRFCSSLAP